MTITCVTYEENEDSCRFRVTAGGNVEHLSEQIIGILTVLRDKYGDEVNDGVCDWIRTNLVGKDL